MIRLIAGLGNPGSKYKDTRHNIGFMVLDELAERFQAGWKSGHQGEYASGLAGGNKVFLLKPMTFMNLSGNSVADLAGYYRIAPEDILVVHDELDFPFGHFKIRKGGADAGHNGVASLTLRTGGGYYRLRMGVAGRSRAAIRGYTADYVLAPFTPAERETLGDFIKQGADAAELAAVEGAPAAMQRFNTRIPDKKDEKKVIDK